MTHYSFQIIKMKVTAQMIVSKSAQTYFKIHSKDALALGCTPPSFHFTRLNRFLKLKYSI